MRFLEKIDVAELNIFDANETSVLSELDNLIVRTALIMENKLPWKLACFVSAICAAAEANECIELHTNWNIPFKWPPFIAEPHLLKGVDQVRWDVFVEGGFHLLQDKGEVI